MKWSLLDESGVVIEPRPEREKLPGSVLLPDWVERGDRLQDGLWYRGASVVQDPGYSIPVGEVFRDLTSDELRSILAIPFPSLSSGQIAVLEFVVRAVAQTELSSLDSRVIGARQQFASVLGEDRIAYLFRSR